MVKVAGNGGAGQRVPSAPFEETARVAVAVHRPQSGHPDAGRPSQRRRRRLPLLTHRPFSSGYSSDRLM